MGTLALLLPALATAQVTVNAGGDQEVDEGARLNLGAELEVGDPAEVGFIWTIEDPADAVQWTWGEPGMFEVTLQAFDGDGNMDEDVITVTVANLPPSVNAGIDLILDEGTAADLSGMATDPGGGEVTVSWDFGDMTPPFDNVFDVSHAWADEGEYVATFSATDAQGATGQDTINVRVNDVAPTITSEPELAADDDEEWTYTVTAFDPGDDRIEFAADQMPEGAEFDVPTRTFTWTPTWRDARDQTGFFRVRVCDEGMTCGEQEFTLEITFTDSDEDEVPDGCEIEFMLDPDNPDDADLDPDGDGRSNRLECLNNSDPNNADDQIPPEVELVRPRADEVIETDEAAVDVVLVTLPVQYASPVTYEGQFALGGAPDDGDDDAWEAVEMQAGEGENARVTGVIRVDTGSTVAWRVRATEEFVDGPWSEIRTFSVVEVVIPDAGPPEPDAAPVEPDAAPVEPDAAPVEPDAAPVEPDAAPVEPDAEVVEPEADAEVDAPEADAEADPMGDGGAGDGTDADTDGDADTGTGGGVGATDDGCDCDATGGTPLGALLLALLLPLGLRRRRR
jgi:MYXO-CTERM domain-containing protein